MADVGTLVSDDLVKAMTRITDLTDRRAIACVRSAEATVKQYCKRDFLLAQYVNESIDIDPGEVKSHNMPVNYRLKFRVKQYPITEWTSLAQVTSRNPTTGAVASTATISRDSYYVDFKTGIITLLETITAYSPDTLVNSGLLTSWPAGVNTLLATYSAGFEYADLPGDLQEIICRVIARIWHQYDTQGFNTNSLSGEMGTTSYINVRLTNDERKDLNPYRRPVLGAF